MYKRNKFIKNIVNKLLNIIHEMNFNTSTAQLLLLKIIFYLYLHKQFKNNNHIIFNNSYKELNFFFVPLKNITYHHTNINILYDKFNNNILRFNEESPIILQNIFRPITKDNIRFVLDVLNIMYNLKHRLTNQDYGSLFQDILKKITKNNKNFNNFYIPNNISKLMAKIIMSDNNTNRNSIKIYTPTIGDASYLISIHNLITNIHICGQEANTHLFNIARMNLLIHNISPNNINIKNSNSLQSIFPRDSANNYNFVLAIPPFSLHWNGSSQNIFDPRFQNYGIAPKSKADYAFLLDGLYHLSTTGTMVIVLPMGTLFRGSKEAKIRKQLILHNNIDTIIGLPNKLFHPISIPTVMIVLKKKRTTNKVLFINATKNYIKKNNQKIISNKDINNILNIYMDKRHNLINNRKYHYVSIQEIQKNKYDLNIPKYIDMSTPKKTVSIKETKRELKHINKLIDKSTKKLYKLETKFTKI